MCSVSLVRYRDNLVLTMNRDESRERHESGLSVDDLQIFPVDSHAGGTWCGVNRHGVLAALLNRYQDVHQSDGTVSRGTIIPMLMKHSSLEEAQQFMTSLSLKRFNPFTLVMADQASSCTWSWNGLMMSVEHIDAQPCLFYSSSSVDAEDIIDERLAVFNNSVFPAKQIDISAQKILTAHVSRGDSTHSRAIFMDRVISHTKSIVQITLNRTKIQFDYYNEAALEPVRQGTHTLPLVSDSALFLPD